MEVPLWRGEGANKNVPDLSNHALFNRLIFPFKFFMELKENSTVDNRF